MLHKLCDVRQPLQMSTKPSPMKNNDVIIVMAVCVYVMTKLIEEAFTLNYPKNNDPE